MALNSSYTHTNPAVRGFAQLLSEKHEVHISETTVNDRGGVLSLCEKLHEQNADIYAFSVYIWNRSMQLEAARTMKKLLPHSLIVLGGPEVSFCDDKFLCENSFVDYLIKGEGEKAICDIADGKYSPKTIVDGGIYEAFADSDEPYFCAENSLGCKEGALLYYESSRGCPYNCSYCLSSVKRAGERVRAKSCEKVKRELSVILSKNVRCIKFVDRTFNFDKARAKELFSFIIDYSEKHEGVCPTCHFEICAALLDDETVDILSKAPEGLIRFEIGVQTATALSLSEIGRRDDTAKIIENVKKLKAKTKVTVHLDLICGLPYDSYDGIARSFDMIYGLSDHLQLGILKLLPGTRMREMTQSYGMEFLDTPPYTLLCSDTFSFSQMRKLSGIADTVDAFSEKDGGFFESISYLAKLSDSPFGLFEKLYDHFSEGKNLSHREKYTELLTFAQEKLGLCGLQLETFREKLRFDFLLSNQGRTPPAIAREYTEAERCELEFFRTKVIHESPKGEGDFFVPALETHFFAFDNGNVYVFDRKNKRVQSRKRS